MVSNRVYDILKYVAQIGLPAVIAFLGTTLPLWGVGKELTVAIVQTVAAVNVLLGSLLAFSTLRYNKSDSSLGEENTP